MSTIGSIDAATAAATRAVDTPAKPEAPDPTLLKAAKDFESIFVRQMLKSLEKTTAAGGNTKPTAGQSTYGSMIVDTLSDSIAKAGGLGLADVVARSLMASHPVAKPVQGSQSAASASAPARLPTIKPLK
jgi:Rod binding domain-containing protein